MQKIWWHAVLNCSAAEWIALCLHTRVKFALICSWDSDCLMLRHICAVVESDSSSWQPGSLRVRLMLLRTRLRLKPSFPVPSWRTSSPMLAFSRASLVSLMAELKTPQTIFIQENPISNIKNRTIASIIMQNVFLFLKINPNSIKLLTHYVLFHSAQGHYLKLLKVLVGRFQTQINLVSILSCIKLSFITLIISHFHDKMRAIVTRSYVASTQVWAEQIWMTFRWVRTRKTPVSTFSFWT